MHSKSIDEIYKILNTSRHGLTEKQAKERSEKFGKNVLEEKKKTSKWKLFFSQFCDVMIIVLCVAAFVSAIIGFVSKSSSEIFDALIVIAIVLLNAVIGFFQEIRAEKSLELLKKNTQNKAKVFRDDELKILPASEIVVGDVISFEAGDIIPADIRIIQCYNLKINESLITGESQAVKKNSNTEMENTPLADRKNMAYSGGIVEVGRGLGVVCSVGENTEFGKIAKSLNESKDEETFFQKMLDKTAKVITKICLAISGIIFVVSLLFKMGVLQAFMTAVAIAVAAIPEGLPAIITIIMALGVQRLAKRRAIVKKLKAIETLGSTNIICSDKTGTLTQNKLTVKDSLILDKNKLFECAFRCNNAVLGKQKIGGGVEIALLEYLEKENVTFSKCIRDDEIPFDSTRKKMSVVCLNGGNKTVFCKGAPDVVLNDCSFYLENGEVKKLTNNKKQDFELKIKQFGEMAYKVIGFAFKNFEKGEKVENNLVFVGLLALQDPPRPEVKGAIEKCKKAGIETKMITGDHKSTAFAIAKTLGIAQTENQVVTGHELDQMSSEEFERKIVSIKVFARVTPQHKVLIVKTLQKLGNVVAMTGDGVNDAPSLKQADIGIGMGKSGTEVAQSASELVLSDDNFSTIVSSVEEGRKIYSNITKTTGFLLSANIAEMLSLLLITLLISPIFPGVVFLVPAQILFVNLITDALPAIAIGVEKLDGDAMLKPPHKLKKHLLSGRNGVNIIYQGIVQTLIVSGVFVFGLFKFSNAQASTMALITLNLIQLFHAYNCRSEIGSVFSKKLLDNPILFLSFVLGSFLTIFVCVCPPLMTAFGCAKISLQAWIICIFAAFLIIPIVEVVKLFQRKGKNGQYWQKRLFVVELKHE